MNFDKFKEAWDAESTDAVHIPEDISKLKEANTPIDKLRRNMKQEFWMQLAAVILIAFVPSFFKLPKELTGIFIFFYGLMIVFTAYYFYKFFAFYKRSYDMTYNSRKNLMWFYYEMKLNIEMYKALTYILFFIGFSFGILALLYMKNGGLSNAISGLESSGGRIGFLMLTIVTMLIIFILAETWPNYFYGKELKKIKAVLDQLD
ncbi:MAG TPA: hypothetical protein VEV16_02125 [Daejeonella sp.]|nr:hypothetical protein [Daejeonella sp.]